MTDKLDIVYKNIEDPTVKDKWIKILQENPTDAIHAYHEALCNDQKENGYCGLLKLFRILGALEEVKNQRDNPPNKQLLQDMNKNLSLAVPEEVKKLQTEHEKLKKEKEERDKKEKEDLEKINKLNSVFKELQLYIVSNMESINNGYSDVNDKVKEALEQLKNAEEERRREERIKKSELTKKKIKL